MTGSVEDATEVQSITSVVMGPKSMRILQDNELMAGLQNGKLELTRPADHPFELSVDL